MYLLLLSTGSLASSLKMSVSKTAACTNRTLFQALKNAYSSYLRCARLYVFADCLSPKALQSKFSSQAMPLLTSTNNGCISMYFILFSLHPTNHGAASTNTKNWMLNGKRSLSRFRLHFIYSFEVDIEQS